MDPETPTDQTPRASICSAVSIEGAPSIASGGSTRTASPTPRNAGAGSPTRIASALGVGPLSLTPRQFVDSGEASSALPSDRCLSDDGRTTPVVPRSFVFPAIPAATKQGPRLSLQPVAVPVTLASFERRNTII